jgi:hypothetical protein
MAVVAQRLIESLHAVLLLAHPIEEADLKQFDQLGI